MRFKKRFLSRKAIPKFSQKAVVDKVVREKQEIPQVWTVMACSECVMINKTWRGEPISDRQSGYFDQSATSKHRMFAGTHFPARIVIIGWQGEKITRETHVPRPGIFVFVIFKFTVCFTLN